MQEKLLFLSKKSGFLTRLILSFDLQLFEIQSDIRNVSRATISGNSPLRDPILNNIIDATVH